MKLDLKLLTEIKKDGMSKLYGGPSAPILTQFEIEYIKDTVYGVK